MTAVYLLNQTPVKSLGWKTPYKVAGGFKLSIAHPSKIGAEVYYLNNKLEHGNKMESQALIAHLVEYNSTNIFQIRLPESHTLIRTQDVVFCLNTRYNGSTVYTDLRVARTVKTVCMVLRHQKGMEHRIS
jgi:hypothetical protein